MSFHRLGAAWPIVSLTTTTSAILSSVSDNEKLDISPKWDDKNWELRSVHVLFRHGARTPVSYLPGARNWVTWKREHLCRPIVSHDVPIKIVDLTGQLRGEGNFPDYIAHGSRFSNKNGSNYDTPNCWSGTLTITGQQECFSLGEILRRRYSSLVNESFQPCHMSLRSTCVVRNLFSMRSFLTGFLTRKEVEMFSPFFLMVAHRGDETLLPNTSRIPQLMKNVRSNESLLTENEEYVKARTSVLSIMQRADPEFEVIKFYPKSTRTHIYSFRDDIISRIRHGLWYPKEYDEIIEQLNAICVDEVIEVYLGKEGSENREESLRLAVGRMLYDIQEQFVNVEKGSDQQRVLLYATHDSFLIPIMLALGILQKDWPPFAADLCLELWQSKNEWKVRIVYCGKVLMSQPLEKFVEVVKPYALSEEEFDKLCPKRVIEDPFENLPGITGE